MTPYVNVPASQANRNALLRSAQPAAPANAPANLPPAIQAQFVRSAIGHAAVLSDTPEKWAATIALLKQHGIDPAGYEDFEKGRPAAIVASGVTVPAGEFEENTADSE